jgi:inosine-uridine nucleoside N-ribohydrolase
MVRSLQLVIFQILIIVTSSIGVNAPQTSTKTKIIIDTDMGSDCDDVGALALLHVYADMGMADIVGCIYSSGKVPYGAGIVEAINIYYGRPDIPIGAYHGDEVGDPVDKMTAEKLVHDTVAFGHSIIHNTDAEEQTRLNRRLLEQAEDSSITYITIGHTKGLHELLVSDPDDISPLTGHELVSQKVKRWVALGALNARNEGDYFVKDWNFYFNNTAPYTKYLVETFPVQVVYIDAGTHAMTGKSLIHTPPGNIVRTAYRDWLWEVFKKPLDYQRPSWDLAAVYYAVEGLGDFLESAGKGWLHFDIDYGCKWTTATNHFVPQVYIYQKEDSDEKFANYLNELIGRKPLLGKNERAR